MKLGTSGGWADDVAAKLGLGGVGSEFALRIVLSAGGVVSTTSELFGVDVIPTGLEGGTEPGLGDGTEAGLGDGIEAVLGGGAGLRCFSILFLLPRSFLTFDENLSSSK